MRHWTCLLATLVLSCASIQGPESLTGPEASSSNDDGGGVTNVVATASDTVDEEAGAVWPGSQVPQAFAGNDQSSAAVDAAQVGTEEDATVPTASMPTFPTTDGGICKGPPGPGDLVVDELMIESVAGTGDHGEWLELRSTAACAFDLQGLHGEAPSGSKVRTFEIGDDLWIPAYGTLVVADSDNPAINHDLPMPVVTWEGQPGDVLRNKGGTVTVLRSGVVIDSVTYPSMSLTVGASFAFPSNCPLVRRADWSAWQTSTFSWFPGFMGTPNAPNLDVQCP